MLRHPTYVINMIRIILFIIIILILVYAGGFFSCATSSGLSMSKKTPKWNTEGISVIAVLPFEVSENTEMQKLASDLLKLQAISQIQSTNRFNIINPSDTNRFDTNLDYDAFFSGKIDNLTVKDTTVTETQTDQINGAETNYLILERIVKITFTYSLTSKDGTVIGTKTIEDSLSDYYEMEIFDEENDYGINTRQSRGRRTENRQNNIINDYLTPPETMLRELITKNMKELALIL